MSARKETAVKTNDTNTSSYVCRSCGRRTRSTGYGLRCAYCFDLGLRTGKTVAGIENEHADGYHRTTPDADCPLCSSPERGGAS